MPRPIPTPPDWRQLLRSSSERLFELDPARRDEVQACIDRADGRKRYLHWVDYRHRPFPEGWSPEELWTLVKWKRMATKRSVPSLQDKGGSPFDLVESPAMQAALHRIDHRATAWKELRKANVEDEVAYRLMAEAEIEEAQSSAAIEGAVTTRRQAMEMIRSGRAPRNTSELMVINTHRTAQKLDEWIEEPLSVDLICRIQATITEGTLEDPSDVGRIRTDDGVRVVDRTTGQAVYQPPPATQLGERLQALCAFANTTDDDEGFLHPVVRATLIHHQLAYDHPFGDGNGRTARVLFMWSILKSGYTWFRSLSISRAIQRSKEQYYRAFLLTQTDEGDATYFVRHQLRCLENEIDTFTRTLTHRAKAAERLRAKKLWTENLNARQLALVEHALEHPEATYEAMIHAQVHGVTQPTAWKDLTHLVEEGLFDESKRSRKKIYRASARLRKLESE